MINWLQRIACLMLAPYDKRLLEFEFVTINYSINWTGLVTW